MLFGPKVYSVVAIDVEITTAGIKPKHGWCNHCKHIVYATPDGTRYGAYLGALPSTCPTCGVKIRWEVLKK